METFSHPMQILSLTPHWQDPATNFSHTWSGLGNVDQFRWLVRADLRQLLAQARDELGLRHVPACAMYSPELRVWTHALPDWRKPAAQRTKGPNWQIVDYCIEGLIELGLKPIYSTCFTPQDFTDAPATCWPDRNAISLPRDLGQWEDFVAGGIRHHIERFGVEEVRSWYFECWNEPNLNGFFNGTQDEFFKLWSATWRAIKSVDASLRIGGPSTARGEWFDAFLDWTKADGTPPDYLISHVYNNDSESVPLSPFDGPASDRVKDSPHFIGGVIRGLRKELDRRGWKGEVHWNEWGRSWFPHDPRKESVLEAAFVVKTMAEVSQDADYFAYWCLSDIYDQVGYQAAEFEGNYGLASLHGLRKPAWKAHVLLNRLGTERHAVTGGDALVNAIATRSATGLQVLVYAYPESIAAEAQNLTCSVTLPAEMRSVRLVRIGEVENSVVAAWRALGSPAYPTAAQFAELKAKDRLDEIDLPLSPANTDGVRTVRFPLERPGIALLQAYR